MGDTTKVVAVTVGVVTLHFSRGKELVLDDCIYVPSVRRNLISVPILACNGFSALFNKNSISIKYDDGIYCGMFVDNLYMLEPIALMRINSYKSNLKRKESSSVNQAQLSHLRLGHISLDLIRRLVTSEQLSPLDVNALPIYESYLDGNDHGAFQG